MTATTLYAGIFYYLGQSLEQLFANKQNVLSKNTDATMRQVSCTDLTVAGSNIISAINLKQNIIDSTKDIQMRNLTCNSVNIAGTNVISLLDAKQDILDYNSNIFLKSLTVSGSSFVSTQAIYTGPQVGEITCDSLVVGGEVSCDSLVVGGEVSCDSLVVGGEALIDFVATTSAVADQLTGLASALVSEIIRATAAENAISDSIATKTYSSGEIIKTQVIYKSSFSFFDNSIPDQRSWQLHSTCSYAAKDNNKIYVTYNLSEYNLAGTSDDAIHARMSITYNGTTSTSYRTRQNYRNGGGGGTRSGTIFPLSFDYNLNGSAKNPIVTINIHVFLDGDDLWTCDANNAGAHFHILEYAN